VKNIRAYRGKIWILEGSKGYCKRTS
jgi:hypothetical protein